VSCYGYQQNSASPKHKNLAFLYNPNAVTLHPEYSVYHIDKENSEINVKIIKNDMFFIKSPATKSKYANISIKYKIYNSFKSKILIDSATTNFNFKYALTKDTIELTIPIKLKADSTYSSIIYLTDFNRERKETSYLFIDKRWYSVGNYKITDLSNKQIVFNNWLNVNKKYNIATQIHKNKNVYISFFNKKFAQALSPFSTNKSKFELGKPDTTWLLTDTITFTKEGFYLLRTDTTRNFGAVLNVFSANFPKSATPTEMLEPIRYLTSAKEFKKLQKEPNRKIAIDKFWLNRTGNIARAKELIRIYYTRQKLANKYFTSYKEGWKTDKGMIYMIYGDPTIVYKSDKLEKWIYGENQTNAGLIFLFERNIKSIYQNDYILTRSVNYKASWYQAVDTWRNGRVFTIVN
jgi:GWxTD domain-containing protein